MVRNLILEEFSILSDLFPLFCEPNSREFDRFRFNLALIARR